MTKSFIKFSSVSGWRHSITRHLTQLRGGSSFACKRPPKKHVEYLPKYKNKKIKIAGSDLWELPSVTHC